MANFSKNRIMNALETKKLVVIETEKRNKVDQSVFHRCGYKWEDLSTGEVLTVPQVYSIIEKRYNEGCSSINIGGIFLD